MVTDLRYALAQLDRVLAHLTGVVPMTARTLAAIDAQNRCRDALLRCLEGAQDECTDGDECDDDDDHVCDDGCRSYGCKAR